MESAFFKLQFIKEMSQITSYFGPLFPSFWLDFRKKYMSVALFYFCKNVLEV